MLKKHDFYRVAIGSIATILSAACHHSTRDDDVESPVIQAQWIDYTGGNRGEADIKLASYQCKALAQRAFDKRESEENNASSGSGGARSTALIGIAQGLGDIDYAEKQFAICMGQRGFEQRNVCVANCIPPRPRFSANYDCLREVAYRRDIDIVAFGERMRSLPAATVSGYEQACDRGDVNGYAKAFN